MGHTNPDMKKAKTHWEVRWSIYSSDEPVVKEHDKEEDARLEAINTVMDFSRRNARFKKHPEVFEVETFEQSHGSYNEHEVRQLLNPPKGVAASSYAADQSVAAPIGYKPSPVDLDDEIPF